MQRSTTPLEITNQVSKFCRQISAHQPVYVPIAPDPHALSRECFPNVEGKIERDGGTLEIGWQIWEWPNVYIEAEFHGIWVSPHGERIDITPKESSVERILFLPCPERKYEGRQVNNIRRALRDDRVIKNYLSCADALFRVMNRGERANMREISLDIREVKPLLEIQLFLQQMLYAGLRENDLCGCGKGKKYRKCCGPAVERALSRTALKASHA